MSGQPENTPAEALTKWQAFFAAGYLAGHPFESTAALIAQEGYAALASHLRLAHLLAAWECKGPLNPSAELRACIAEDES